MGNYTKALIAATVEEGTSEGLELAPHKVYTATSDALGASEEVAVEIQNPASGAWLPLNDDEGEAIKLTTGNETRTFTGISGTIRLVKTETVEAVAVGVSWR